jgi:hypothetical protein
VLTKSQVFSLAAAVAMVSGLLVATPAVSAQTGEIGYAANAYGTEVNVQSTVTSGRSALSTLGCTSTVGVTHTNTAAGVSVPGVLSSGTIDTTAASQTISTGVASTGSADIQNVSLLGGLVSASAVDSVSTTSLDSQTGAFGTSAAGTQFADLSVAGVPILLTPAPNTKINLPGVGYVELNQQSGHVGKSSASLTVIGIHVDVTVATPLAAVGTQIVVGFANSSLGGPTVGLLSGLAYGGHANVAHTIIAGELFPQPLACFGTHGVTKTNSGAALSIPGVLTSGTVTDTAEGVSNAKQVSGQVTSTVQGLNLLNGTVAATAVEADVTAAGNPPALADNSSFVNLTVAGYPGLSANPAPNTKLSLAGIGTLWLHRVFQTANSIKVIMVQLIVTVPGNPLGLAVGTTVDVAVAQVDVD